MDKNRLAKRLNLLTRQFMARESTVMMTMAVVVGGLTGLGAVLLRRLLAVLVNVFFVDFGEGVLGFMGPYSIIVVPAVGGSSLVSWFISLLMKRKDTASPRSWKPWRCAGGEFAQSLW